MTEWHQCQFCGAPKGVKNAGTHCRYCESPLCPKGSGKPEFPHFQNRPIACPNCDKKALRPRIRTNDFRCQACSATFPAEDIEHRCFVITQRAGTGPLVVQIVLAILRRNVPIEFAQPRPEEEETGCFGVCLGGMAAIAGAAGAGYAAFRIASSKPLGERLLVTAVAAVIVALLASQVVKALAAAAARAAHEADPQTQWERKNPYLAALRGAFGQLLHLRKDSEDSLATGKFTPVDDDPDIEQVLAGARALVTSLRLQVAVADTSMRETIAHVVESLGTADEKAQFQHVLRVWEDQP